MNLIENDLEILTAAADIEKHLMWILVLFLHMSYVETAYHIAIIEAMNLKNGVSVAPSLFYAVYILLHIHTIM